MIELINSIFLKNICFCLLVIIWSLYVIFDSFTLGIGLLTITKINDEQYINNMLMSITPFWRSNQVWLILGVGGTFVAFPLIFSKMFTWLYLPMMLLLFGLIIRGISIELLRDEAEFKLRKLFKFGWFTGSLLITIVLGLFFSNLFYGFHIGFNLSYYGTFFSLINKFTLFGLVVFYFLFLSSGSIWLSFKTKNKMSIEYFNLTKKIYIVNYINILIYLISLFNISNFSINYEEHILFYIVPFMSVLFCIFNIIFLSRCEQIYQNKIISLLLNCVTILFLMFSGFITLHPYLLKSTIDIVYGISIYTSSSSDLTLLLMLIVALIFVPIITIYQLLTYRFFRDKIQ